MKEAKAVGLQQWIFFIWGCNDGVHVVPYDIRTMPIHRYSGNRVLEQQEVIGDVVMLKIMLPSGVAVMKGKVDTGAEISSMHVSGSPKIVGDAVKFENEELSHNVISAPLADRQAVSSADGGVEYRPVVEFDIEVNGKPIRRALFNLNDRSKMDYPVLIGQNILEKTGFLVDPNKNDGKSQQQQIQQVPMKEENDWVDDDMLDHIDTTAVQELLETTEQNIILYENIDPDKFDEIYEMLNQGNISIGDLFKRVRTEAVSRLDKIEY